MPKKDETVKDEQSIVKTGNGPKTPISDELEPASDTVTPSKTPDKKTSLESRMEQLLSVVEAQQETIKKQEEKNTELQDMIQKVADKSRLKTWEERTNPQNFNVKNMRLATYKDKVVLAWTDMKANNVYKKENKAWVEEFTTELIFEDGEKELVDYKSWMLGKKHKNVILKLDSIDPISGKRIVTVEDENNNIYNVDVRFINP
jgi:hypothetical protein